MNRFLTSVVLPSALLAFSLAPQDKQQKAADVKFDGRYTVVSGERDGRAVPDEKLVGSVVVFDGNKITGYTVDNKEFLAGTFVVDKLRTPWIIRMKTTKPVAAESVGLIEKDGNTVRIIYALPGGPAPAVFRTERNQEMFSLRAVGGGPSRAADAPPPARTSLADEPPGGKSAAASLVGTYTIVSGSEGGKPIPRNRLDSDLVIFTADEVYGIDRDKKRFFAAKYVLDSSRMPWVIRMKSTQPREADATGLIEKSGDTIRLIYNLPGGKPPDDFKPEENQQLFVLRPLPATGGAIDRKKEK